MSDDPRYTVVNSLHAQGYPPLTRAQAGRAARALLRRFGRSADASAVQTAPLKVHVLERYGSSGARRCWASTRPTSGVHKGWGRLIHDLAHLVHRYRHPGARPHATGEHVIETEIAHYVRTNTEWLVATAPKVRRDPLTRITQANQRDAVALERWQRKERRARNAIRKISRRMRARLARAAVQS